MTGDLAAAAEWYAARGVRVFPLRPYAKTPLLDGWQNAATTDVDTVRGWWVSTPNANIGAVMGGPFDVVDLDTPEAINDTRDRLGGVFPPALGTVTTPRKRGVHFWLPATGRRRAIGILPGVDWLGAGGYAVAPPSIIRWDDDPAHGIVAGEGTYQWTGTPDLDGVAPAAPWLALWADRDAEAASHARTPHRDAYAPPRAAGASPWARRALAEECATVAATPPGTRNETLNRAAFRVGQLVPHLLTEADAADALAEAARACGLTDAEAGRTIGSGLDAGRQHPRQPEDRPAAAPRWAEEPPEDGPEPRQPPEDAPGGAGTGWGRLSAAELHDRRVDDRAEALRVDRDARARLAAETRPADPFDAGTLAEVLARPPEPAARVAGLIPWQASTLVVAQRKTGKTTLVLNLARSLLTGESFLGSLAVRPIAAGARVGVLNYEVSAAQLARWAEAAGVPVDRLFLVNLRGRRNPLSYPDDRARLAALLHAQRVESLLVDPFGRAYSGDSQNDAGEVGAWLTDLDRFARAEAGALDVILTAHAGWNGERTRGSSALEDWADSIITLTRDDDTDARYLRAAGRDVDLAEDRLDFHPDTRTLTLSGAGTRKTAAAGRHLAGLVGEVVGIVAEHGPMNGNDVAKQLRAAQVPHQKGEHSKALRQACEEGLLTMSPGAHGAKIYTISGDLPQPTPDLPHGARVTYPNPPYRGGVGHGVPDEGPTYPNPDALDPNGLCRLHHGQPVAGCYTCDALAAEVTG